MVLAPVTTMWTAEAMDIISPSTFAFLLFSFYFCKGRLVVLNFTI